MARIGIIGTGWGTRVQVPRFREAGLEIASLYGRDAGKTRRLGEELEIERVVEDWREMLAIDDIDLVTIVTPPFQHREMAIAALEAGKHILTEKPTALNAEEAKAIADTGREHPDQIALVDHELRFLPSVIRAKSLVETIGDVFSIHISYSSPSRNDRDREWSWWSDASQGGGVLGAVGSHMIDLCRHLAGEIEAISADLRTNIHTRRDENGSMKEVTSDDYASLQLRMERGAAASIVLSVVTAVDEPTEMTLNGSEGGLRIREDQLYEAEVGGDWKMVDVPTTGRGPGDSPGGYFGSGTYWIGRALAAALDEGDRAALEHGATLLDGVRQQEALDAARLSDRENGSWIEL